MAIHVPWARTLIAGDYLSAVEIPTIAPGGAAEYEATLTRLEALVGACEHVVPGHGPVLDRARAQRVLGEDRAYLADLRARAAAASLPPRRRSREQRRLHALNAERL